MELDFNTVKWDMRFLKIAQEISTWSKDPSTKVGAVIIDKKRRIVSTGYNGLPRGSKDDERLLDREWKYMNTIHGEINAVLFSRGSLNKNIVYTYPFMPCSRCAAILSQKGIARVVSFRNNIIRWAADMESARHTFSEHGIELIEYGNEELEKIT